MMLALLVMGVSNAFADYEYYKVVFAGLDGADQSSAGYGLRTTEHPYSYNGLTNNNPTVGYISGYNLYNNYYGQLLSSSNVQDYIAPYTIMGYSVSSMTVSTRTSRERIGNQYYDVYTITITLKGNASGTKTLSFRVNKGKTVGNFPGHFCAFGRVIYWII